MRPVIRRNFSSKAAAPTVGAATLLCKLSLYLIPESIPNFQAKPSVNKYISSIPTVRPNMFSTEQTIVFEYKKQMMHRN